MAGRRAPGRVYPARVLVRRRHCRLQARLANGLGHLCGQRESRKGVGSVDGVPVCLPSYVRTTRAKPHEYIISVGWASAMTCGGGKSRYCIPRVCRPSNRSFCRLLSLVTTKATRKGTTAANRPSFTWLLRSVGKLRTRFMDSILSMPSPFRKTCLLFRTLSSARSSFSWIVRSWSAMQDLSISICDNNLFDPRRACRTQYPGWCNTPWPLARVYVNWLLSVCTAVLYDANVVAGPSIYCSARIFPKLSL